jgi:hypothetical protein
VTAPAGLAAQLGIAEEIAYGTYVAPARYLDLVKEKVALTVKRIESQGLRAGRRVLLTQQWAPGERSAKGTIDTELANVNQGVLWKYMFGSISASLGRVTSADGTGTISLPGLTSASAAFTQADVGRPITGTGIAALTTILSVTNATTVVLSANLTSTITTSVLTIGAVGANQFLAVPADLTGLSTTIQIGRPDITAVVRPFSYLGCKFTSWTLACKAGEIAKLSLDVVAQDETTSQSLGVASYPALMVPLTFVGGTVTVGGVVLPVKDFTLKGDNKLDDARFFLRGAATPLEPLENAWREYTGSITVDFNSLTQYANYTSGAEMALVLTFLGGQIGATGQFYSVNIVANIRYDGDTPEVAGPQILSMMHPFKCTAPGASDTSAIQARIVTGDAVY